MPSYVIRNENFRDEVLKVPYPFDAFFIGEVDDIVIDNDVFIDAHFYFKTAVTLPISITEIDGTYGDEDEVRLRFSDADNNFVGSASFVSGAQKANVYNTEGINVGILVMDALGCGRFVSSTQGRYFSIVPGELTFHIDTCKVSKQPNVRYVAVEGAAVYGSLVEIIARHGVEWSRNGDILSLNVLGDYLGINDGANPVLSVNGVKNSTIWLNASPESNLRINTNDRQIMFGQAKDLTE